MAAVGGQVEVYLDSGVRNGSDVVKALCLGARGVLLGRAWAWPLAARGGKSVQDFLGVVQKEMANSMALMGVNRIDELGPHLVEMPGQQT